MARANKVVCPHCGAAFKSVRGVPAGKAVQCPQCGKPFTAGPDAAADRPAGGVNADRLVIVLISGFLYLLGGGALAFYCVRLNARTAPPAAPAAAAEDLAPPTAPTPPPPAPPSSLSPEQQRKIDDAIVNGVWFLRGQQRDDGTWGEVVDEFGAGLSVGLTALPGLTLLECGVPATDPAVAKAADYVRNHAPQLSVTSNYDTYQVSLALLFLDRLGNYKDKELIQYLALRLVAGQRPDDGGWGYKCPPLDRKATAALLKELQDDNYSLDNWRRAAEAEGGPRDPGRSDNSNTQFAVLALWVAHRHDVPIERTMALVGDRFRQSQQTNPDGSWWYSPADNAPNASDWATMTCSGLLGLAVANGTAKDGPSADDKRRIERGLAMLGGEIDRPGDTRGMELYFLWSLERVAVLYDLKQIANKDWYAWGLGELLPAQQANGGWPAQRLCGNSAAVSTSFALLFLKQANLAKDLTKMQLLSGK